MHIALRRGLLLFLFLFSSFCTAGLQAQSATQDPIKAVPPELRPWVDWVLTSEIDRSCAFTDAGALCAWPGQLTLDLNAQGGRFELPYELDRARDVALVGSATRWPEQVKVDGREVPVLLVAGSPVVHLSAGAHRVEGVLKWKTLPERIELPREIGLVSLQVNGQPVPFPRREDDGSLWLGAADSGAHEVDELSLSVTRKISDGVPLLITTRLSLRVSGRARELVLGKVTLPASAAIALQSELPARLSPEGELRLQARPGIHRLEITARSEGSPQSLQWIAPGPHWPATETWVWEADDALRQVAIAGVASIDPARTELADDWRTLPAYLLRADARMQLSTLRRGEAVPPPNRVKLSRDMWLDLDGHGYTIRDQLAAELKRTWRLSLEQGALGRVSDGTRDLLITQDATGHPGVELRARSNNLSAEWRADTWQSELPAVAWSEDVQALETRLHMGPGWSLLAASGVDSISQSWIQDWDLFGFFFVLVVTLAFAKLFGVRMGVLALLTLVLTEHESEAPHALWFVLLVGAALLQALPESMLRSVVRAFVACAAVTMLIVTVMFAVTQIRMALYPQLAEAAPAPDSLARMMFEEPQEQESGAPQPASAPMAQDQGLGSLNDTERSTLSRAAGVGVRQKHDGYGYATGGALADQDPDAVVQTGPGLPTWTQGTWHLRWSGPVDRAQRVQLWLLPPSANRVLALMRALLLCVLAGLLLSKTRWRGVAAPLSSPPSAASAATLVSMLAVGGALLASQASSVHAQSPSPELLEQLRQRIAPTAECRGHCVSLDELSLTVDATRLRLSMQAHALENTAIAIPGPVATWAPQSVTVDGRPASAMLREDGFLLVRLAAGVHSIEAAGPVPSRDSLLLAMTELPRRTQIEADGWAVDGVRDDGQVDGSLLLSRLAKTAGEGALEGQALPEWLELERHLQLGATWQIVSTLRRVSPIGTPVMAHIALLPGESIVDAAYEVKNGALAVSLGRDVSETQWTSTLAERPEIALAAAKGTRWSERWVIECSAIWRCELSGLPPLSDPTGSAWLPTFKPWPGESLRIALHKPKAAPGQTTTIDDVRLVVTPGQRIRNSVLDVRIRASRGGAHEVTLGAGARVQVLKIDDKERALQQSGPRVGFTLEPGVHQIHLEWQEPSAMRFVEEGSRVTLDGAVVNVRTALNIPGDRWLLWASGPSWGPAILFWGRVLLVLMLGLMLGRTKLTPLRSWEWMLLGLGLTQIEVPLAFIVVGWFFAMQQRAQMPSLGRWAHNLAQVALVSWTLLTLTGLYEAVHQGLLMQPNMQVAGAGSTQETLRWYSDHAQGVLPAVRVLSAPLWLWRVLMLLWALWLAARCIRWLPWALSCMRSGGGWKKKPPKPVPPLAPRPVVPQSAAPAVKPDTP